MSFHLSIPRFVELEFEFKFEFQAQRLSRSTREIISHFLLQVKASLQLTLNRHWIR